ncbi:hypothetical protein Q1695_002115 [Nippostrongylus brasiliensis]|nr:hypothetical protein Q1695_002115 [Nippostrongylus brasiliensis]
MNSTILDDHAKFMERLFNSINTGVYTLAIFVFCFLVVLIFTARSLFHPMFSLLFSLIILGYMACNALSVSKFYLQLLKLDTENVFSIIDTAYQVVYVYLTCTVTCCVFERFFATVYSGSYEFRRNYVALLLAQGIASVIVFLHVHVYHLGGFVSDITQFALSCIIVTCLALLLLFNRRLTLSTRGVRPLTHRYQITENIRALRLVAPVVLLDTSVCAVDMLGSVAFDVLPNIDAEIYRRESTYLPAYIVLRAAAILLQYGIPVVIVRDKCMRKTVLYFISKLCKISMEEKTAEVRDVLGAVVPKGASQTDYFNYLQQQWTVGFR